MQRETSVLPVGENPAAESSTPQKGAAFSARLAGLPVTRLGQGLAALVDALDGLVRDLRLTPTEFRQVLDYLTDVGHAADARRQEWVLLADALGLSALVEDLNGRRPAGCTPNTGAGPFYRADAPLRDNGATISLDGVGTVLQVRGRVLSLNGAALAGALVEVWQANGQGKYENQEPDLQPENNLRGRLKTDAQGRFAFRSVMPGGYALPSDGPVGQLMTRLGLCLIRPAHIHFRVSAAGHERLTTHIFDRADPAINRDAIFGVKPELLADFRAMPLDGGVMGRALDLDLVLCPLRQG
ncbi:dioxygenase family protein [Gemmobacter serpentinus]|uniref:dioxygenase family protein n=1 Tax=Gemmobacter serpentinus TaxID=2652247 RepID=UPI00124C4CBE|nr:dioxygenase [Gemmobacter serpentinus]